MSDEQLKRRDSIRKMLIGTVLLLIISCGILYFCSTQEPLYQSYLSELSQEGSTRAQINTLTEQNNNLLSSIESSGEELVSFSEDRIKYINLASSLSLKHEVNINELTVSDVWVEGEMSGITTAIEIEGTLQDTRNFLDEYCSTRNVNRIVTISCRPSGRYAWLSRSIDGNKIISWFDLTEDSSLFSSQDGSSGSSTSSGVNVSSGLESIFASQYMYDPATGRFVYILSGEEVPQEVLDETPISLEKMFADQDVKIYLVIDFLGRA